MRFDEDFYKHCHHFASNDKSTRGSLWNVKSHDSISLSGSRSARTEDARQMKWTAPRDPRRTVVDSHPFEKSTDTDGCASQRVSFTTISSLFLVNPLRPPHLKTTAYVFLLTRDELLWIGIVLKHMRIMRDYLCGVVCFFQRHLQVSYYSIKKLEFIQRLKKNSNYSIWLCKKKHSMDNIWFFFFLLREYFGEGHFWEYAIH